MSTSPQPMPRAQAIAELSAAGQPYELLDKLIQGRRLRVFRNAPASLRDLFEATASDLPFLSYQDERFTFAQAWQAAARIAQAKRGSSSRCRGRRAISPRPRRHHRDRHARRHR